SSGSSFGETFSRTWAWGSKATHPSANRRGRTGEIGRVGPGGARADGPLKVCYVRRMVRPILAGLALLGLVVLAPGLLPMDGPPRVAGVWVSFEMDIDALLKRSQLVVVGPPAEAHGTWETGEGTAGRRIVTYSRVVFERVVDGTADRSETWVRS